MVLHGAFGILNRQIQNFDAHRQQQYTSTYQTVLLIVTIPQSPIHTRNFLLNFFGIAINFTKITNKPKWATIQVIKITILFTTQMGPTIQRMHEVLSLILTKRCFEISAQLLILMSKCFGKLFYFVV